MNYVDNCMQREATRLTECLDISTKDSLIKILEAQLVGQFAQEILKLPPEVNPEDLPDDEEIDIVKELSKNRTEFDTFLLEKRIDDL